MAQPSTKRKARPRKFSQEILPCDQEAADKKGQGKALHIMALAKVNGSASLRNCIAPLQLNKLVVLHHG